MMSGSADALQGYHTHIYYSDANFPIAAKQRDTLAAFPMQIG
jgi:aromatic ring-cleaving dioxygenase